eukprot:7654451-Prorocentrum_lima.AAC.1
MEGRRLGKGGPRGSSSCSGNATAARALGLCPWALAILDQPPFLVGRCGEASTGAVSASGLLTPPGTGTS